MDRRRTARTQKAPGKRKPSSVRSVAARLGDQFSSFGEWEKHNFETSSYPIRIFDHETLRYLAVNDAALRLYGYTREEFLRLTPLDTRHPDERQLVTETLALPTGLLRHLPARRHVTKSGETIIVELIVQDILYRGRKARLSFTIDVTQRVRNEETLRRREAEYCALVHNAPDIIARFDRELRCRYVNPAIATVMQIPPRAIIGRRLGDLDIPAHLVEAWSERIRDVFGTATEQVVEFGCECPGGTRYYETRLVPEIDDERNVESVLTISRDITTRKQAEEELKRQKRLLEAVIENLPVGVFMKEAKTLRVVMRNRANRLMMQALGGDEIGKTPYELHPKALADAICAIDRKVLETGEMVEIPAQEIVASSGKRIVQHVRKVPVLDDDGRPWLLLGIADDVTERRRIETALRDSEEFLRRMIESSRDCIKVLDLDGRITWVNAGGLAQMDAEESAFVGRSYLDFWNQPEREAAHHALLAARAGSTARFEGCCPTAAGTLKWWDEIVAPILGPDGKAQKVLVASRDVSERKLAERELSRQRRLLEAIIDSLPLAIFVADALTGEHVLRNRLARERFGELPATPPALARGASSTPLAERLSATDRMAFDTRRMLESFEEEASGPSGRRRIEHVRKVPLFDEDDRPWMLVGIADDITQQRRREEELNRQKKLLAAVIEHLPVGVTVKDARTLRYLLRNRMAEALTGLSDAVTRGKRADEAWAPELARSINETDAKALAGGAPLRNDFTALRQLRGRIVRNLKVPVPDDRGKYTHIVSILEDLTDIEAVHNALRSSEERLKQLIAMSPAAIFSFSLEPPYAATYISDHVLTQVGWSPSDFAAPGFWESGIHPEDRARVLRTVERLRADGRYACEYRFRHKNGTWRWMHDEARVVLNADGSPREGIGVWMDITEQHEEAEERLQRTIRQRDALVKEVHHRIKNHLQGIAGLVRQKVPARPEVAPLLDSVVAQMNSVALVYGLQSGAATRVTVEQVLKAVCASLEGLVPCRIIHKWDSRPAPPLALSENAAVPIAVALNELMYNAAKHGDACEGIVTIEVEYTERESHARICIANAGKLPAGFDYASGASCGTGLDLVKTLLDPRGSALEIIERDDCVHTVLTLDGPLTVWQPLESAA